MAVAGFEQFSRAGRELVIIDESGAPSDFLRSANFQALTTFDRADEVAGIQERIEGPGVQPSRTASQYLYGELPRSR